MLTEHEPQSAMPSAAPTSQHPASHPQQPAAPAHAPPPQAAIQSNVFAAALAQAMGVLNQQQGSQ